MPLLSARGLVVLLAGVAASAAGSLIGEPDLVLLGVFLVLLPLAALVFLWLAAPSIAVERTLSPAQTTIGDEVHAVLRLRNTKALTVGSLQFTDEAPAAVSGGATFRVARAFGSWRQAVSYQIHPTQRGHFLVGPLRARFSDPLGLVRRTANTLGSSTRLRVTPRLWPLDALPRTVGTGASRQAAPSRLGQSGQDDVLVREYHQGDDMRRVHWRLSAKHGDLMVRLAEEPWDPSCTLLVDCRSGAHAGTGADSGLEWAISAVASSGIKLIDSHWRVTVIGGQGSFFDASQQLSGATAKESLLEALTDLQASPETSLSALVQDLDAVGAGTLVAALGVLTEHDAATLVALSARALRGFALVPDAAAWEFSPARVDEHLDACRALTNAGWALVSYRPGESLPQVWRRLFSSQAAA